MKLLFSSPDAEEVGRNVKRLVLARIPCAVCKDPVTSCLSLWIQQDGDYLAALELFARRAGPRPVAPWASALDPSPSPASKSESLAADATNTESSTASAWEAVTWWDLPDESNPIRAQISYFRLEDGPSRRGSWIYHFEEDEEEREPAERRILFPQHG
jgi:hypothetical protein